MKNRRFIIDFFIFFVVCCAINLILEIRLLAQEYPAGLISYWNFDEGSGSTVFDNAGSNDGTIYGATWVTCQEGSALSFDGVDDYVDISNVGGFPSFTQMIWVKRSHTVSNSYIFETPMCLFHIDPWNVYGFWSIKVTASRNGVYQEYGYSIDTINPENFLVDTSRIIMKSNQWYHLAVTANSDNSELNVYLNGELVGHLTWQFTGLGANYNYSRIGGVKYRWGSNLNEIYFFNGELDDAAVFNRALTAKEIQQIYLTGPSCKILGSIVGTVTVNDSGLEGVTVILLDNSMDPVADILSDSDGEYSFTEIMPSEYYIMIVEPLGYTTHENPKFTILGSGETNSVDFPMNQVVLTNNARSKGYWKHQFDVHVKNKGNAQETQENLESYIAGVHRYYDPHFSIFADLFTFTDWQDVLSRTNQSTKLEKTTQHLAALALNFISLKIGYHEFVTLDNKTCGDALTFASTLIENPDASQEDLELAKDIAEKINNHQKIGAGIVPSGNILYKGGVFHDIYRDFGLPKDYTLYQNYPNPFNPETYIKYALPRDGHVTIKIYDLLGNEIISLINKHQSAGYHSVIFNGTNLTSGIYFYKIKAEAFIQTRKMLLLK